MFGDMHETYGFAGERTLLTNQVGYVLDRSSEIALI